MINLMQYNRLLGRVFVTLTVAILTSCEWLQFDVFIPPHGMVVFNNSDDTIVVYTALGADKYSPTAYPDTMLPVNAILSHDYFLSQFLINNFSIPPHEKTFGTPEIVDRKDRLSLPHPIDTISIFFMSMDTLKKYGYDDVRLHNRIMDRYDISYKDLKIIVEKDEPIFFPRIK